MVLSPELKQMCDLLQKIWDASVQWDVKTRQVGLRDVSGRSKINFGRFRALKVAIERRISLRVSGERKGGERRHFCWFFCRQQLREKVGVSEAKFGPNSLPVYRISANRQCVGGFFNIPDAMVLFVQPQNSPSCYCEQPSFREHILFLRFQTRYSGVCFGLCLSQWVVSLLCY